MPKSLGIYEISVGQVDVVSVDMADQLDKDGSAGTVSELLSGTPTVTAVGPSGLTITNKQINPSAVWILNKSCPASTVVQFKVSGHARGVIYKVTFSVDTDGSPVRTLTYDVYLKGV